MNSIINYIILDKYKYINNTSKSLTKFKKFIDTKKVFELVTQFFLLPNTKYNDPLYFIRPISIHRNKDKLKFDVINKIPFYLENNTILKTKLITWEYPILFFMLFNYLSLNITTEDNILIVSKNYGLVELLIFNKFTNFDHLYYNSAYTFIQDITDLVKNKYKFNNFKYGDKMNKKYKFMIFDLILENIFKGDMINEYEFKKQLKKKEKANLFLLKNLYNYLDNLELNASIIIMIGPYFREETLLMLENILGCFEDVKFYKLSNFPFFFPHIYCRKFKNKQKLKKKLSLDFYNLIIKIYNKSLKFLYDYIELSKYINNLISDRIFSDELKQLENKNFFLSNEVAKFIKFETYLFQDNINIELSNNLQQLFLMDQPINILLQNHKTHLKLPPFNINYHNNNILLKEINIIYNKYNNTLDQLKNRPASILNNITTQITNYQTSIIDKLNEKLKIKITDEWLRLFELLRIINFDNLNEKENINLLYICHNDQSINAVEYYIKNYTNKKLTWELFNTNKNCIKCKIKKIKDTDNKSYDNMDWIICDNISDNIKLIYSNILFILSNLKENGNFILTLTIPLNHKILIDALFLLYSSFEKIIIIKPIHNKFNTSFFIVGINHQKIIFDFNELYKILDMKDINSISIIDKEYNNDFKYQFIKIINLLTINLIENNNMQLFYTDFWNNINSNIKNEINSIINIKNIDYIKTYF